MPSLRSEPFLWIHLAGIALFPALLELVWLGLAIGKPLPFAWLEFIGVAALGTLPVLWMQLTRPFDIFSIAIISLRPEQLTASQRQILARFKTGRHRWSSAIAAAITLLTLWLLFHLSPLAIGVASWFPQWRILGLAIATVAFLGSNLFLQVPIAVLNVLLSDRAKLAATQPYPMETIDRDFTVPGFKVNGILSLAASSKQPAD